MRKRTSIGTPAETRSGGWLSRKDWRRALHLYLDGRITRSGFERMKQRLTRVRGASAVSAPPPRARRLQLVIRAPRAAT